MMPLYKQYKPKGLGEIYIEASVDDMNNKMDKVLTQLKKTEERYDMVVCLIDQNTKNMITHVGHDPEIVSELCDSIGHIKADMQLVFQTVKEHRNKTE